MAFVLKNCAFRLPVIVRCQHFVRNISVSCLCRDVFNVQDNDDFEERVLKSEKPVIVDFHATWCGPCKILTPRLESLSSKFEQQFDLAKVDIDKLEDLAERYEVKGVPAVFGVKNGKIIDQFVGIKDEDVLEAFIKRVTAANSPANKSAN